MLHLLKRHPVPIEAHFEWVLVLTYALPEAALAPLLRPRLQLDTWRGNGFLAVALVQTRQLRPAGVPRLLGQDFFLSGYRIFSRLTLPNGKPLRGLQILRSDTDRRFMTLLGNAFTHYNYELAEVCQQRTGQQCLEVQVRTSGQRTDLDVLADLHGAADLPAGSPFDSWTTARRFAGPLPHTFSYEPQTGRIVVVRGTRQQWQPRAVRVEVRECAFVRRPPFEGAILASAFYLEDVAYRWERGWLL